MGVPRTEGEPSHGTTLHRESFREGKRVEDTPSFPDSRPRLEGRCHMISWGDLVEDGVSSMGKSGDVNTKIIRTDLSVGTGEESGIVW